MILGSEVWSSPGLQGQIPPESVALAGRTGFGRGIPFSKRETRSPKVLASSPLFRSTESPYLPPVGSCPRI